MSLSNFANESKYRKFELCFIGINLKNIEIEYIEEIKFTLRTEELHEEGIEISIDFEKSKGTSDDVTLSPDMLLIL